MRVVVAPDKFAGSISAPAAAAAFERGWRSVRPDDDVLKVPLSDGGPGFLDCLSESLGGVVRTVDVAGPWGDPVSATVLATADTWYVEAAKANGHDLPGVPDPLTGSSVGVGEIVAAAIDAGAVTVVVGLGGSATNDGGAGLLAALGARAWDARDDLVDLAGGPAVIGQISRIDLAEARRRLARVRVLVATDVDNPLLGNAGATAVFGPQKGLGEKDRAVAEESLTNLVRACVAAGVAPGTDRLAGAGAAGGLGYGLLALGGTRTSGAAFVADAVDLERACRSADLVVTGEGSFDAQSLRGKVVIGVAEAAGDVPVVVLAGRNRLTDLEWRRAGFSGVVALEDRVSTAEQSMARAAELMELAAADLATSVRGSDP